MQLIRPGIVFLFIGDVLIFIFSLWLTLTFRFLSIPSTEVFLLHLTPFLLLFAVWAGVFFISGLYEKRTIVFDREIVTRLFYAQLVNVVIAALFFFSFSLFGIAPKTILLIYLLISFPLTLLWRIILFPLLKKEADRAIFIGEGKETEELVREIKERGDAHLSIGEIIRPSIYRTPGELAEAVREAVRKEGAQVIVIDVEHGKVIPALPDLYKQLFTAVRFIDLVEAYEEVFGRIPLSLMGEKWIARNVSRYVHTLYDALKRLLDIVAGGVGFLVSLPLYPFIALAIKMQDGGPIFLVQERAGMGGKTLRMYKFRSMTGNDSGKYGASGSSTLRVTPVGKFLRTVRLDELPQLWNVLRGDLSLIGPRPEFPTLVALYEKEIPYYGFRHLIKPGLSGWAQLYHDNHPHHAANIDATREKLSYDLYYLRHRSFALDFVIGLKTIRKIVTQSGS